MTGENDSQPLGVLLGAPAGAELLVAGSRGHGGFTGVPVGSVTQHLVQHAACPAVVIPAGHAETARTAAPVSKEDSP